MAKDETFIILLVITLIDVAASNLYLSRPKSIMNEGESMAVLCKDEGGQLVTWRGPHGLLRANTQPSVQDTSIGKLLKFNSTKKQHTGNYTCSLSNNMEIKKVFTLIVEEGTRLKPAPEYPFSSHRETLRGETRVKMPETGNERESETGNETRNESENETENDTEKETDKDIEKETDNDTEKEVDEQIETDTDNDNENRHFKPKLNTRRPLNKEPILFKDTPSEQRAVENKQILLRCEVSGEAEISWKIGPEITETEGVSMIEVSARDDEQHKEPKFRTLADGLLITNVSRADSTRTFICQASQTATGAFLTKKIKLIVEHKPEPAYEEYEKVVEVYGFLGEFVNLTCSVMAQPAPTFSWEKKTGEVLRVGTHQSILQIYMTERAAGTYQCTASNRHGELITIFNLLIGKKPEPPVNMELLNFTTDSLTLGVGLPLVPLEDVEDGMEPKWLVVQYRVDGTEEWNSIEFNITQEYGIEEPEDPTTTEASIYGIEEILYLPDLEKKTKYEIIAATKNVATMSDYTNATCFETSKTSNVRMNTILNVILVNLIILFVSTPA